VRGISKIHMRVTDLGITDFSDAYSLQKEIAERVYRGESENTIIITEHRPVITIGRKGSRKNIFRSHEFLSSRGISVFDIDRGGDVTYHGPGQIVAYPIVRLENGARDIHRFLRFLEEVGENLMAMYGLASQKIPGLTGIWIGDKKIGSIGIGVKKWVTYHGMALNINIDLEPFSFIRPCGIEGLRITSLKDVLGREVDIEDAKSKLKLSFNEVSQLAEAGSKI
ncbi:MAG: lipoyl(octanoyl) transferase LipB, partial [Candidatus Omnitrophica bacterium]|nr:lipoyl(octanoyl) transferase LipB [Candidatus Omnitrophota bacterium]